MEAPDSKESRVGASRGNLDEDLRRGRQSPAWIALWALRMITLPRNRIYQSIKVSKPEGRRPFSRGQTPAISRRARVVLVPACHGCRCPALHEEASLPKEVRHLWPASHRAGHHLYGPDCLLLARARACELKGLRARIPTRWFAQEFVPNVKCLIQHDEMVALEWPN